MRAGDKPELEERRGRTRSVSFVEMTKTQPTNLTRPTPKK